jgi:hypothetical protein
MRLNNARDLGCTSVTAGGRLGLTQAAWQRPRR